MTLASNNIVAMLATADAGRSRAFYEGTLGLRLVEEDGFALVFDANGTTLRVAKVREVAAPPYTSLGWSVPDVRGTARALAAKGVTFERYEGMGQDELGVWTPPGSSAGVCWFKDPDGNLLSLSGGG
jgi:catechol 2,3-dioxygenase-like lactoylglutathione lyase family enzyme